MGWHFWLFGRSNQSGDSLRFGCIYRALPNNSADLPFQEQALTHAKRFLCEISRSLRRPQRIERKVHQPHFVLFLQETADRDLFDLLQLNDDHPVPHCVFDWLRRSGSLGFERAFQKFEAEQSLDVGRVHDNGDNVSHFLFHAIHQWPNREALHRLLLDHKHKPTLALLFGCNCLLELSQENQNAHHRLLQATGQKGNFKMETRKGYQLQNVEARKNLQEKT